MDILRTLLRRYLKATWRRRWLGVGIAWLVCLIGWAGVSLWPNKYESSARIYVNTDAVLTPLLKGLAVDTSPAGRLKVLQGTLLSRPNMATLISKTDLDLTVTGPSSRDALIASLMRDITVRPGKNDPSGVFSITYDNADPKLARDVVQALLTIFIENATGTNRRDMENARVFLQRQIASYEQQLQAAEKRRADFRAKYPTLFAAHGDVSAGPDIAGSIGTKIVQLEGELIDTQTMVQGLEKEIAAQKAGTTVGGATRDNTALIQAEQKLRMLRMRYTDTYPGVIAAQQEVAALKAGPGPSAGPTARIENTVRDQLQLKLVDANGKVSSLKRQIAALTDYQTKLNELQRRRPNLMAEYQNMDRDYGILRKNYDELLGRLQAANIGQAADTQADKIQIRVIDPPVVPANPIAPNRLLLITGVLVAGIAAGFGLPILLSQFDQSFWVVEDLRSLGLPVLGGISLLGGVPLYRRFAGLAGFGVAVLVLIALYGGLMLRLLRTTSVV